MDCIAEIFADGDVKFAATFAPATLLFPVKGTQGRHRCRLLCIPVDIQAGIISLAAVITRRNAISRKLKNNGIDLLAQDSRVIMNLQIVRRSRPVTIAFDWKPRYTSENSLMISRQAGLLRLVDNVEEHARSAVVEKPH